MIINYHNCLSEQKQNYFSTVSLTLQNILISLYRSPLTLKFDKFFPLSCILSSLKLVTAEHHFPFLGDVEINIYNHPDTQ